MRKDRGVWAWLGEGSGWCKAFPRDVLCSGGGLQSLREPTFLSISRNRSSLLKHECTGKDKHQGKVSTCLAQALTGREMNHEVMYRCLFTPPLLIDRHCALTTIAEHNTLHTAAFTQAQKWEPFPLIAALLTPELLLLRTQLLHQIPATTGLG